MLFVVFGSLFQLLFWGAVIFGIVKLVSGRTGERAPDAAPMGVKDLLLYGSLYAALHVAAWGVAGLIGLPGEDRVADQAATPLALTAVGVPILFFLARWVLRTISDPNERGVLFTVYLNVTVVTALIVLVVSSIGVGHWLVGEGEYSGIAVGAAAAWAPIWVTHWRLWRRYRDEVSNLHVYVSAGIGLTTIAITGGVLISVVLFRLLDSATAVVLDHADDLELGTWLVALAVGAVVFAGYWVNTGMRERRDTLWHGYVVLVGVLGGLVVAVIGAGIALFGALQWLLGDPSSGSAVRHFADFAPAVAALVVGGASWWYHRRVLGPRRGVRTEVQRVYDYVVSAVGLVTAIVGVVILIIGFQEAVFPPADSMTSEVNILLGAITTLAVGAPLWAQAWWRASQQVRAGSDEAASPTRRTYLFAVIGISALVAAVSLIALLVTVFNDLLGEGGDRLRDDIQLPVALIVAVGAVAVYHFLVFREEKGAVEAVPVARTKQVLLVTGDDVLATAVRDLTGARVTLLRRLDTNGQAADAPAVAEAIRAATEEHLLVVPGPAGVEVIPYQR